jgi:Tfp pilus assembly protein FimT
VTLSDIMVAVTLVGMIALVAASNLGNLLRSYRLQQAASWV